MKNELYLVLQNGMVFLGRGFGYELNNDELVVGEAVFSTSMTGFVETLTDKSYYGQIIVQTFPLVGNYGVSKADFEGDKIYAKGYIVREFCDTSSNFRSDLSLDEFLKQQKIVGICDIDTRRLTKLIREEGVMNAVLTKNPKSVDLKKLLSYKVTDVLKNVSSQSIKLEKVQNARYDVALLDFGYKEGIVRELQKRNCNVRIFPYDTKLETILSFSPNGIMLSNGPGDPKENSQIIMMLKELLKLDTPIFGICLGHQLLALASGLETFKLKYGHRGANQPVKDLKSGRVYMTSQNHGYCVKNRADLKQEPSFCAKMSFVNVNDGTIEGLDYNENAFSVQFHPEGAGGPLDTSFLFDRFVERMKFKERYAI